MTASGPTSATARDQAVRNSAASSTRQALARVKALSEGLASGLRMTGNEPGSSLRSPIVRGWAVHGHGMPSRSANS